MWWMKAAADFEYDPKTFMWTVKIAEPGSDHPFSAAKQGKSKHWFLPIAYAKAVGEYYGFLRN